MKNVKTGIKNFDRLLGGGIPEKEIVLLKGEPGAGKSNLGLEFLYRGAEKGETGLYVSFQDTEEEIMRVNTFDWDFDRHVENDDINIRKFDPYRYEQISDLVRGAAKENNADRVVIDPITDLDLYIDSRKDIRSTLLSIKQDLSSIDATTILVAETDEATEIEEEVADGIIEMEVKKKDNKVVRSVYVRKLRGTDYNHGVHNYILNSDGIKIQ